MREKIAVIGLGFVGLPLSLSFAARGYPVIGLDVNRALVSELNEGITHHLEQYRGKTIQEILREALAAGAFRATGSYAEATAAANIFIVTVSIPIADGNPVFHHFQAAMTDLGRGLRPGDLVLIRSTVMPGTTEEIAQPLLERESGLKAGRDFHLAYASERIAEGKAFEEFENMPTVVAGVDSASVRGAKEVLRMISKAEIHAAPAIKMVETAKAFENVSRDVNIALANQFARFCQALGIDTPETFRMANTHTRVRLLTPGPGVGGYCLPSAYYYLRPKERALGVDLSLAAEARRINDEMPAVLVRRITAMLEERGKALSGAVIAVLGLAMKDYSNDDRCSPAHQVCRGLAAGGARVRAYDPAVPRRAAYAVDGLEGALARADALVVLARQKAFDELDLATVKAAMNESPVLVDTKHLFRRKTAEALGFDYFAI